MRVNKNRIKWEKKNIGWKKSINNNGGKKRGGEWGFMEFKLRWRDKIGKMRMAEYNIEYEEIVWGLDVTLDDLA